MQHVICVYFDYNIVTFSISSMPLTKVITQVVNNYQHTTEKEVALVTFCKDLTKPDFTGNRQKLLVWRHVKESEEI